MNHFTPSSKPQPKKPRLKKGYHKEKTWGNNRGKGKRWGERGFNTKNSVGPGGGSHRGEHEEKGLPRKNAGPHEASGKTKGLLAQH